MQITPSNEQERCCICLHVRFATILLGCYLIVINTSYVLLMPLAQNGLQYTNVTTETYSPKPVLGESADLKTSDDSMLKPQIATTEEAEESSTTLSGETTRVEPLKHFLNIAVAIMLVYGAHSYKSMYLMPFMCIRFFQLLRTVLTVAAWLTHAVRDYDAAPQELESELIEEEPEMKEIDPFKDFMESDYGFLAGVLFFFLYLNILIYTLSIVWRCYKFILRRNRENIRRINNLTAEAVAGSASFWGPDGSVNPPVATNWMNDLERAEFNIDENNTNGNRNSNTGSSGGMNAMFKLPNYSEVAKDPDGKKFLIVNIPNPNTNSNNNPPDDEACPSYSGTGASPSTVDYDRPPPPAAEGTEMQQTGNNTDEVTEFDGPPPSYDQVRENADETQNAASPSSDFASMVTPAVPDLTTMEEGEVGEPQFSGSLQVDDSVVDNPNSAV